MHPCNCQTHLCNGLVVHQILWSADESMELNSTSLSKLAVEKHSQLLEPLIQMELLISSLAMPNLGPHLYSQLYTLVRNKSLSLICGHVQRLTESSIMNLSLHYVHVLLKHYMASSDSILSSRHSPILWIILGWTQDLWLYTLQ